MNDSGAVALLGHPVSHSLSPAFQNVAFKAMGLDMAYIAFDVPPHLLEDAVKGLKALGFAGANVTVPHKVRIIDYLDYLSPEALRTGAVNTIVNREGQLEGHNTDVGGLIRALEEAAFSVSGCHAVVVGAGGAGRAAAFALAGEGCHRLTLVNRTLESAETLVKDLAAQGHKGAFAMPLAEAPWGQILSMSDLLVNATTLGLAHNQGTVIPPGTDLPEGLVVCDLVYADHATPLEALAISKGLTVVPGAAVLLHQGALAFTLWTGLPAPIELMRNTIRQTREGRCASEVSHCGRIPREVPRGHH